MNTAPGGDAMTVRYHREEEAAHLKAEEVRRPIAWRIHPDDMARLFAEGRHCEARRPRTCRRAITVVAWRWWRSAAAGRVLATEHFVCTDHGQEFARRHRIEIDPAPDGPSIQPELRDGEGGSR